MPDITMCQEAKCPKKESCYRFTAKPSDYQSFFAEDPRKNEKGEDGGCRYFWSNENRK